MEFLNYILLKELVPEYSKGISTGTRKQILNYFIYSYLLIPLLLVYDLFTIFKVVNKNSFTNVP